MLNIQQVLRICLVFHYTIHGQEINLTALKYPIKVNLRIMLILNIFQFNNLIKHMQIVVEDTFIF